MKKTILTATLALLALTLETSPGARAHPLGVTLSAAQAEGIVEQVQRRGGGFRGGGGVRVNRSVGVNRNINRNVNVNRGINRSVNVNRNVNVNRAVVRRGAWVRPARYTWGPGGAIAAGAAIGVVSAATAAAWAGAAPGPNMCWYYTDQSRRQGFWDVCQ